MLAGGSAFADFNIVKDDLRVEWERQDRVDQVGNITKADFIRIIDEVIDEYTPIAKELGGRLKAGKHWTSSKVFAEAKRTPRWWVKIHGGLARRKELSQDGLSLIVCHEMGHHLAGYYFSKSHKAKWSACEGQADYYSTHVCARRIWRDEIEKNAEFREQTPPPDEAKEICDEVWEEEDEQNLCYRIAVASENVVRLSAKLNRLEVMPLHSTPDEAEVEETYAGINAAQCRLDTLFQGSLCKKEYEHDLIPGRKHPEGQRSLDAELESAAKVCTASADSDDAESRRGVRPRCWFRPLIQTSGAS